MEHWDGDKLHVEINHVSVYFPFFPLCTYAHCLNVIVSFFNISKFDLSFFLWLSIFSVQGQYLQGQSHALCDLPPNEPGRPT
jgi:hypothetical protein